MALILELVEKRGEQWEPISPETLALQAKPGQYSGRLEVSPNGDPINILVVDPYIQKNVNATAFTKRIVIQGLNIRVLGDEPETNKNKGGKTKKSPGTTMDETTTEATFQIQDGVKLRARLNFQPAPQKDIITTDGRERS